MADAEAGEIDIILVKSVQRFARNTVDALTATRRLKALGVSVFFERDNINTSQETSELYLTLMAAVAQEESHSLSENMKWGIRKRFAAGIPKWSATYGYKELPRKPRPLAARMNWQNNFKFMTPRSLGLYELMLYRLWMSIKPNTLYPGSHPGSREVTTILVGR